MNRRVAVRGIVIHDGKVLAFKLKAYDGKPATDYYSTPGGGLDVGEPILPALEREMIEETGIKPVIGQLLFVQQFIHNGQEQMEFFFHITNAEDYQQIDLSKTTHGAIEIEHFDFFDTTKTNILPKFLREIDFKTFNPDQPTAFYNYI